ncbi:four helix bundle protein [Shewanella litorisediminis]|uniref:Four helix bundle protein n=1 Tax=Shewanella litorisediminis TaxID=1173586 RepID=A0ABX7FZR4_9GAMM|nr:four helix bundle protein [Shewanella litorisediminis]MCL2919623.1 four helix bundle protein [Shewanella litorisediminis]QRH00515.1 four helix bundle protein [Shewanella litorisediminis]
MTGNAVLDKSFQFAVRIVKLSQHLVKNQKEFVLSKQLLRSGTSIGANVNEAQSAQSHADFIAKMAIASKEARETHYWLLLLCETDYLNSKDSHVVSLLEQSEELIKLIVAIVKSAQQNQTK